MRTPTDVKSDVPNVIFDQTDQAQLVIYKVFCAS